MYMLRCTYGYDPTASGLTQVKAKEEKRDTKVVYSQLSTKKEF